MSHEESQLSKNHEWHRAILQAAMDGFWMVDMQGRLLEVNAAYCRMTGYSEAELLTMNIADLEDIETAEVIAAHIARTRELG
ncbi:MAG: PAS domain-containing protein, partial [Desulfuromonadales bacterium]|nr:PAS domain-containing protein [Desulfuromonadales bacterium]